MRAPNTMSLRLKGSTSPLVNPYYYNTDKRKKQFQGEFDEDMMSLNQFRAS